MLELRGIDIAKDRSTFEEFLEAYEDFGQARFEGTSEVHRDLLVTPKNTPSHTVQLIWISEKVLPKPLTTFLKETKQ